MAVSGQRTQPDHPCERFVLVFFFVSPLIEFCLVAETPNIAAQNINALFRLQRGNFVIMSTKLRFYIGEVLDIYKQAAGSRYGSVEDATAASGLSYLALKVYLPLQVQQVR